MAKGKRAIGIVRVSQMRGRDQASLPEQRERVEHAAKAEGLELVDVLEERDVSGGTPLEQREGLRSAVEAVESGAAEVIIAAYFDRLVRSLRVQDELVSRVEAAGGSVLTVDVGRVTNGSAAQWLSSTLLGAVAEHQRRVTAERVGEAQRRAIARGVAPWRHTTPGYTRNENKVFTPNKAAPAVAEAFRMRGGGASVRECRDYLAEHGMQRTLAAVSRLFHDRAVLGELHFGGLHNLSAHPAIVTPEAFKRAGAASAPRGRVGKSDRLLARLGVLRCGTCEARMVVGTSNHGTTPVYRCPSKSDCPRGVVITAKIAEAVVTDAVREALRDLEGRASVESNVRDAEHALERTQAELDAAIRTLAGLEDEAAARERLVELREARDGAEERIEQLCGRRATITVSAVRDWGRLSLDERRDLIRATIARATVAPGRGADRVTVESFGQ